MPRTSIDLATRALSRLGKVASGQPPAAEDLDIALDGIRSLIDDLQIRGLVYVPDEDAIDDSVFLPLASLLAASIAEEFEASEGTVTALSMKAAQAEARLRELRVEPIETAERIKGEFF
jgi:hypothetical protein